MNGWDPQEAPAFGEPLEDLPLRADPQEAFSLPLDSEEPAGEPVPPTAAPLSARWTAFAGDAATVLLLVAGSALGATAARAESPRISGLPWAAAFAIYLSFFTTVVPLALFGKTVGMALSSLSARPPGTRRLTSGQSSLRWLGTLLTAASFGFPLLLTGRDPEAPSLADRLSGRALVEARRESRVET